PGTISNNRQTTFRTFFQKNFANTKKKNTFMAIGISPLVPPANNENGTKGRALAAIVRRTSMAEAYLF
ncbi:MAG: hypothetical protein ACK5HT_10405, partial [Draconibacterium sp.]